MAYRITRLADEDLVSIARYTTQQWGEAQCRTYIEELFILFERVGHTPLTSPAADYIQPGLRKQSYPNRLHVVYFRIGDDGIVEILRVLHAHQNRDNAFEREI